MCCVGVDLSGRDRRVPLFHFSRSWRDHVPGIDVQLARDDLDSFCSWLIIG